MLGSTPAVWNSLEIAKLVVMGLTPLVVAIIGLWVAELIKRVEAHQWANRTAVEWKMRVYEELAPILNDIYCYFLYVGSWKRITPEEILEKKRQADRILNLYRPLFSNLVDEQYSEFIHSCFETWRGKGVEAGLRTGYSSRVEAYGPDWDAKWNALFVRVDSPEESRALIHQAYSVVSLTLAEELGLPLSPRRCANPSPPEDHGL